MRLKLILTLAVLLAFVNLVSSQRRRSGWGRSGSDTQTLGQRYSEETESDDDDNDEYYRRRLAQERRQKARQEAEERELRLQDRLRRERQQRRRQQMQSRRRNNRRTGWGRGRERPLTTTTTTEDPATNNEDYGNYLVHLGHRREDNGCPEGQVQDIYGYCREIFYTESRDWDWWENIRNFIFGGQKSGYQSGYYRK